MSERPARTLGASRSAARYPEVALHLGVGQGLDLVHDGGVEAGAVVDADDLHLLALGRPGHT